MSDTLELEPAKPTTPVQQELPLAYVRGEALVEKPEDLFIPPDALEVILEAFEGPLDLLLYLIRKQKFDILDLPVRQITVQYMEYVDVMKDLNLELAAEYLVMAAILAEIKSRLLLPRATDIAEDEADPRAELIRRLQDYEMFKQAAVDMDGLPRYERDFFYQAVTQPDGFEPNLILPDIELKDLVFAFQGILRRASNFQHHHVTPEILSTRARMSNILEQLKDEKFYPFDDFFEISEGKSGVVVTFLAILELVKEKLIELQQNGAMSEIYIRLREHYIDPDDIDQTELDHNEYE